MNSVQSYRIPFLGLAIAALIIGIVTGLGRMGFVTLVIPAVVHHGAIMTGGFLGTLIILEKIIPLKKRWLYVFPLLSGLSVILFLCNLTLAPLIVLLIASLGLAVTFLLYLQKDRSLPYILMLTGSLCWFIGNVMLLRTYSYPVALGWWMCFILCVISAERIELMKFLPVTSRHKVVLVCLLALFPIGNILSLHSYGNVLCGMSLVGTTVWLLRFDVISISLKKHGLTRYVAIALTIGYFWLLVSGIFLLAFRQQAFAYDITVHTFFIGFVFSMIFAHGPIILPGVLGVSEKPYHPVLYAWLILLQLSLVVRIAGGAAIINEWRMASGLMTGLSILLFFPTLAFMIMKSRRASAARRNISIRA
jgi:hypothetical protein